MTVLADTPFETVPITALRPKSRQQSPKVKTEIDALVRAFCSGVTLGAWRSLVGYRHVQQLAGPAPLVRRAVRTFGS